MLEHAAWKVCRAGQSAAVWCECAALPVFRTGDLPFWDAEQERDGETAEQ